MKTNRKKLAFIIILGVSLLLGSPGFTAASSPQAITLTRLYGETRYATAGVIAKNYNPGMVQDVILTTGNDFADALSASVLAHQKKAPILLADKKVADSGEALTYITEHLDKSGTVYLIGGLGAIGQDFETRLNNLGFYKIVRIAGADRYETSDQIARSLTQTVTSTVVLSSGESYPDALSIAGFAAQKGWPILLTPHNALPGNVVDYLLEKKPVKIYLTGGAGVISENIVNEIAVLLPEVTIERLAGQDRFETNIAIARKFNSNPSTLYLATGYGFADALAGSVLAARSGDPIIFINPAQPTLPKATAAYFAGLSAENADPNLVSFGGSGVVSYGIIEMTSALIAGTAQETSIYSVADITAQVKQRQSYVLPATVQATLYNSDIITVPIKWNPVSVSTNRIGSTVYEGVVEGYNKPVRLYLTVVRGPLSEYTTYFDSGMVNRSDNIRLAAEALNGHTLSPGDLFSFNQSVGRRTAEAGYKEAPIIMGEEFVPGVGGGVCQVSTTLYNAAVLADLEIVERHHHTLPVAYVPAGQDATVSYPALDLKFRNTLDVYIVIRSSVEGNTLTFQLYERD
jgi:putative cell wall-binding protein